MAKRNLVVITGSSGVGKSALAAALQDEMLPEVWLRFSVDSVYYCLPPTIVERVDHYNDRSLVDSRAIVEGAYACARAMLDQGQKVILRRGNSEREGRKEHAGRTRWVRAAARGDVLLLAGD